MTSERIICPYCDRKIELDDVERTELFTENAHLAARLGPAWRIANEYIDCFRRARGGRMSLKKRIRLLREVVTLWEGGEFVFDGRRYRVTQAEIKKALGAVCNRDIVGLENHNYLKKVMMPGGERLSAEGLTAHEEKEREQKRLFDSRTRGAGEDILPPDEIGRRARELVDKIGGGS